MRRGLLGCPSQSAPALGCPSHISSSADTSTCPNASNIAWYMSWCSPSVALSSAGQPRVSRRATLPYSSIPSSPLVRGCVLNIETAISAARHLFFSLSSPGRPACLPGSSDNHEQRGYAPNHDPSFRPSVRSFQAAVSRRCIFSHLHTIRHTNADTEASTLAATHKKRKKLSFVETQD